MTSDLSTRLRALAEADAEPVPPIDELILRGRRRVRTKRATTTGVALTVALATALAVAQGVGIGRPTPAAAHPVSLAIAAQISDQLSYQLTLRSGPADAAPTITLDGGYDATTGNAFLRDGGGGNFAEQRIFDGICWVSHGGQWDRTTSPCFQSGNGTNALHYLDPARLVDELTSDGKTTYVGRSNGVDTWRFVTVDRHNLSTLTYGGTATVEVATRRILSVEFTNAVPGNAVSTMVTVSYHDYGAPVVVTAP
ncbi:MAG TPA: hypothetical protein VKB59_20545 [Micromonosporaceae bacterium]|nr:hypothetical protein [Micromonosporaceae bacterium]